MTSCLTYVRRQQGVPVLSHVVPPNEAHFLVSVPSLVRSNYREQSRKPWILTKETFLYTGLMNFQCTIIHQFQLYI